MFPLIFNHGTMEYHNAVDLNRCGFLTLSTRRGKANAIKCIRVIDGCLLGYPELRHDENLGTLGKPDYGCGVS